MEWFPGSLISDAFPSVMANPKRILVTGSNGLIGRYAARSLGARGHEVHGVSRSQAATADTTHHAADLLNAGEREALIADVKPELILHLAWETTHGAFWSSPRNLDWIGATLHLARLASEHGCRRFVGAGTCAEYAPGLHSRAHETRSPVTPRTLYGTAKLATFQVLQCFLARVNVSFAWGRIFMLYGGDEHPERLVAYIARALTADQPASIGPGAAMRDFMHVADVGHAMAALALAEAQGAVNIGTGQPISVKDLASTLGRIAGKPHLIKIGALPARAAEPPFLVADTTRLHQEVGFHPSHDLHSGLAAALAFWQGRNKGT